MHGSFIFGRRTQSIRRRKESRQQISLVVEILESRNLLSATTATSQILATPDLTVIPDVTNRTPQGYTPSQISQAYGFNQITFSNGTVKGNGAGQTIAIVDATYDPDIASDLQAFDKAFGIANPPSFTQTVQAGTPKTANADWSLETALDVEWAHAMAPGAKILLVEAKSASLTDLLNAVNYARSQSGVSVVSMSWGAGEFTGETAYDSDFTTPAGHTPVAFVASAGDGGAGATWPSISSNVLSVGGTTLNLTPAGNYVSESAWNDGGGGASTIESEPSYQLAVQHTGMRTSPDVAYDAGPNTGFAVYDTVPDSRQTGWFEVGGTSAGAPQWSALLAIADQGLALSGQSAIGNAAAVVYTLPSSDFHDVTTGSNGHSAGTGYDLATGLGSPYANLVVSSLVSPPSVPPSLATTILTSANAIKSSIQTSEQRMPVPSLPFDVASQFATVSKGTFVATVSSSRGRVGSVSDEPQ